MDVDRKQLGLGTAWITPDGILFRGGYYSCRRALREGWYDPSNPEPKPVTVLYDEQSEYKDAIYIDSEAYDEDGLCRLLAARDCHPESAARYQMRIRELKTERSELGGPTRRSK